MRYLVEEKDTTPQMAKALFRVLIRWAADHSSLVMLKINPIVYANPAEWEWIHNIPGCTVKEEKRDQVEIRCKVSREIIDWLSQSDVPEKAVSGDLCPAEDVEFYHEDQFYYGCYDYGRDQILELSTAQLEELTRRIAMQASLSPKVLVPLTKVRN